MADQYDVFVSYSHSDSEIARNLVQELESADIRCFLAERDVAAGDTWKDTIRTAIERVDRVLLLITPRSRDSTWVNEDDFADDNLSGKEG
jgi:hypothetical protein